jgi:hypothetical protein
MLLYLIIVSTQNFATNVMIYLFNGEDSKYTTQNVPLHLIIGEDSKYYFSKSAALFDTEDIFYTADQYVLLYFY